VLTSTLYSNRASATAHKIIEAASSSYVLAQSKVHDLSDTMLAELKKIQAGTYQLPSQVQGNLKDISDRLTTSIHDLSSIISSEIPLNEKASKLKDTVQQKVHPLLNSATSRVQEILKAISSRGQEAKGAAEEKVGEKTQNGSANGHPE
jgi:DNA anti-recombination protein RmuC